MIKLFALLNHNPVHSKYFPLSDYMYQCRIQITISLSRSTNTELQAHYIFPLYVLLARPTSNLSLEGVSLAFSSLWSQWQVFVLVYQMISFLSTILFCSILQFIDSVGLACLLLLVNLEIRTTVKPHSSFLMWRVCQPPVLATLTLSLLAVVQCTSHMSSFFFISVPSLNYFNPKGQVGQSNGEDNCSGNHVEGSSLQSKFMLTFWADIMWFLFQQD
jgi:hypothetical protein